MIRHAIAADIDLVRELWDRWWDESPVQQRSKLYVMTLQEAIFAKVVAGIMRGVALLDDEGAILLWAEVDYPRELQGFGVYVKPNLRRDGVGGELVRRALQWARANHYERIIVAPYADNHGSQAWLEKLGFSPAQVVYQKEL